LLQDTEYISHRQGSDEVPYGNSRDTSSSTPLLSS